MEKRISSKFRQTTTGAHLRRKQEAEAQDRANQRFFSRDFDHYQTQQRSSNFRRSRSTEWDKECLDLKHVQSKKIDKPLHHGPPARGDHKGQFERPTAFHMGTASRPSMKTLDKKISVSSDQLDTLTSDQRQDKFAELKAGFPIRQRASYRFPKHDSDLSDGDVIFKYKGANYSKNEYFFGNTDKGTEPNYSNEYFEADQAKKTPYQMFLEDDGPYSRKLYGPIKHSDEERENSPNGKHLIKNFVYKSKDYFALAGDSSAPDCETAQAVKKGLLWHQKDKLFSRWKERFFIITKDYFHCFKKDSSKLTEMGEFLFKVKLVDIDGVSLLDKRGYLTICISQLRDGRLYLRKHEDVRDWFNTIQCTAYESKRRRKFWVKGQNIGLSSKKFSDIYDSSHAIAEEDIGAADDEDEDSDNINNNVPKGINRLSLVSDLLMSESMTDLKPNKKSFKSDDSGHDSGQSSLNTGDESFSESSG